SRQVAAENLRPVQVNHRAVILKDPGFQAQNVVRTGHQEEPSEVSGDEFVRRVRAEAHHGRFVAVAVAELRRPLTPSTVIEQVPLPCGALVGAIVQKLPDSARGNQGGRPLTSTRRQRAEAQAEANSSELSEGEHGVRFHKASEFDSSAMNGQRTATSARAANPSHRAALGVVWEL